MIVESKRANERALWQDRINDGAVTGSNDLLTSFSILLSAEACGAVVQAEWCDISHWDNLCMVIMLAWLFNCLLL